jgi:3-phenylpropionate/cinnamic acid dioxygenase small subunit
VRDDWFLLSQRVDAMVNGTAWAESPHSTTTRMISNVQARRESDEIEVRANFVIHRSTPSQLDIYPGSYLLRLVPGGPAGFRIRLRRATLALVDLRPQGRVSIIL